MLVRGWSSTDSQSIHESKESAGGPSTGATDEFQVLFSAQPPQNEFQGRGSIIDSSVPRFVLPLRNETSRNAKRRVQAKARRQFPAGA